jgi:hypothetical protein
MKKILKHEDGNPKILHNDYFSRVWGNSWTRIKATIDLTHEPVLILDETLRVIAANKSFYQMFQVKQKDTKNKFVYELGNGKWNIPSLKKLLEETALKRTSFKGFEISCDFPTVGNKTILVHAQCIYRIKKTKNKKCTSLIPPHPIILLVIEDVTEMVHLAEGFASHINNLESKLTKYTKPTDINTKKYREKINTYKRKFKPLM